MRQKLIYTVFILLLLSMALPAVEQICMLFEKPEPVQHYSRPQGTMRRTLTLPEPEYMLPPLNQGGQRG